MTVIGLLLSLVAILGAAVLFTNAVEILGERLEMGSGSVGSILAAVGTALPETMIPVVAIFGRFFWPRPAVGGRHRHRGHSRGPVSAHHAGNVCGWCLGPRL